ncbi:Serine/threonine-protein kinase SRPK [Colletotrichum tanaceti]|uniref:non-specific serine/threonine protein kinase n=1 Tax=Colletotrichum tanaceti TaxID=1306861 RepID=A0A4U6X198_9PEZI|nr:Serine/threonine-protein kinase SRPK [Colletotrichum tanaceti]TKW49110.1 Serine/threonine-protein kinase SRPK [Colletotrichum tanaceti]
MLSSRAVQVSSRPILPLPRVCSAGAPRPLRVIRTIRSRLFRCHYSAMPAPAPPVEYGYVDGVEHLGDYGPGGYHPVHIDDRLDGRYRVVHKLGHGTFSTAWLAVDENLSKYVAVKVGTADADCTEVDVLSLFTPQGVADRSDPEHLHHRSLVPVVLDRFSLGGPNGTHPCLVTLPARCSLRDAKEASGNSLLQLDVARSLAAQLVLAVSLVHSKGYAHGGERPSPIVLHRTTWLTHTHTRTVAQDLHLGNLLLQLPSSLDTLSIQQLYARYGEPEKEPVIRLDTQAPSTDPGVPSYAVPSVWLGVPSHQVTLADAKLILGDFGVAFRPADKSRSESYTPLDLRPPEAFFEPGTPLTLASDVWSLGCVLFELVAHRSLVDGFLAPRDEITAQQVELQGPMPPEWWGKWEERPRWYDDAGRPLSDASDIWPWGRRFEQWVQSPRRSRGMETMGEDERDALLKLLGRMLAWRPGARPSVLEVLEADWMTRWALPTYQKALDGV